MPATLVALLAAATLAVPLTRHFGLPASSLAQHAEDTTETANARDWSCYAHRNRQHLTRVLARINRKPVTETAAGVRHSAIAPASCCVTLSLTQRSRPD